METAVLETGKMVVWTRAWLGGGEKMKDLGCILE